MLHGDDQASLFVAENLGIDVVKSVTQTSASPGSLVTFTIEFVNHILPPLSSYEIRDQLPANLSYVPGSTTINGSVGGNYDPMINGNTLSRKCGINILPSLCPLGT